MIRDDPLWTAAAERLAEEVTAGAPEWRDAVSAVPRHLLIPRWWEPVRHRPAGEWLLCDPREDREAWITDAFEDVTRITRVGSRHADHAGPGERATGSPTSSGTLPGLVVLMLHHLDAQPGDQILDVGSGPGYAAALTGHRFGDDHVTSVDVDPYLVRAARERLALFGRFPRLETVDATGSLAGGEYDRIVATVSVRPVPASWIAALRPGGRIVTTLARTPLLLVLDKDGDDMVRGRVTPEHPSFMVARREADYPPGRDELYVTARDSDGAHVRALEGPVPDLWKEWELQTLFELQAPAVERRAVTLPDGRRILFLLGGDGSWARVEESGGAATVHQDGPRALWDVLCDVRQRWDDADRFPLHHLAAEVGPDGGTLTAPGGWTFAV